MKFFVVHILHPSKPENNVRHEFESDNDFTAAFASTEVLRRAYLDQQVKEPMVFKIVVLHRDQDKPTKAWEVRLPEGSMLPCEVPCGYCGGSGGVDSGGADPQGAPMMIECPSCHPKPDVPSTYREEVAESRKINNWCKGINLGGGIRSGCTCDCPECKEGAEAKTVLGAWQKAFGTSQLTHAIAEMDINKKALELFQNNVWASLNNYSNALGWGLTGIQPECWTCLDLAVGELVQSRAILKDLREIIMGRSDNPDPRAVVKAAQLLKDLYASSQNPRA